MRWLLAGAPAVLSLLAAMAEAAPPPPGELRGLWVVRTALVSPRAVDRVVDDAVAGGFNALFVQVRGRGDAFYASRLASRSSLLWQQPEGFDPLARLITRARTHGLQVHAWVNVLLAAHFSQPLPRGHVLQRHPEWVMVPRSAATAALVASPGRRLTLVAETARREGDAEGYYLSPFVPGVGDHLDAVVRELVRAYAVDGLHFDFIRYPGPDWDYSRAALEAFRRATGRSDLLAGPEQDPEAWADHRRRALTSLASRLSDAARVERPGLVTSAAVAPDAAQAVKEKFQDWPAWLASGVLAALAPMTYTPDDEIFVQQVEHARSQARVGQPIWAGIGAYRLSFDEVVQKVALARRAGAGGVLVFSHESLSSADFRRLRQAVFPVAATAAVSPAPSSPGGLAAGSR
jgi:uncharacterized lipoprotein YddW (UPF0748 family)